MQSQDGDHTLSEIVMFYGYLSFIQNIINIHSKIKIQDRYLLPQITLIQTFFFQDLFYFICVIVLPVCMSVCHMYAWCSWSSEDGTRSPGTKVIDGYKSPCGCWELN